MNAALLAEIEAAISAWGGKPCSVIGAAPASGGCIHRSFVLDCGEKRYFAKTNGQAFLEAFSAEAQGLNALRAKGLRAPEPICHGSAGGSAYLVLEYLELRHGTRESYARLGQALAALHSHHGEAYGWPRGNFIGANPQRNHAHGDWPGFWREERLLPQLRLAARSGLRSLEASGERLCSQLEALLAGHRPAASLLHGDLWSGNAGFLADGTPVLFDPAVYHGDRETDLAMTELFGGFPPAFSAAYRESAPVDTGYAVRKTLYNLYHVLNHANLFGGGYAAQAQAMIARLLAEVKA